MYPELRIQTYVMQERRIDDYWNVDGSRDLSDSWTGFIQFNIQGRSLMARTPDEMMRKCPAEGETKVVTWKAETR